MATGDVVLSTRPRAKSNQRFDLVEFVRISQAFVEFMSAAQRALASDPIASAGSPTGELWQGSVTANPTVATDGLVRVDSALFVGLDADGRLVLKPVGTELSVAIPDDSSDYQVYLYMNDVTENTQVRRRLPATSPFTEFAQAFEVDIRGTATLFTRSGGVGSVVADDVAGGATRALLFLGIANNTGGDVTFTPAENRLETVTAPAALPAGSTGTTTGETTVAGSANTLRGLINNSLHAIARDRWKGSNNFTPTAANNFGAYTEIDGGGLDAAFRGNMFTYTIGDDSLGLYGDYDRGAFADDTALWDAVLAAIPNDSATIFIKSGVTFDNFNGDVDIPIDKSIKIVGPHYRDDSLTTFDFGGDGTKFNMQAGASSGSLEIHNCSFIFDEGAGTAATLAEVLSIHDFTPVLLNGCVFKHATDATIDMDALIVLNDAATAPGTIRIIDCDFVYDSLGDDILVQATIFRASNNQPLDNFTMRGCTTLVTFAAASDQHVADQIFISDLRDNFLIEDCLFRETGTTAYLETSANAMLDLQSDDDTAFEKVRRRIRNCTFVGNTSGNVPSAGGIFLSSVGGMVVENCEFSQAHEGVRASGNCDGMVLRDCLFEDITESMFHMQGSDLTIRDGYRLENCRFLRCVGGTGEVGVLFRNPIVGKAEWQNIKVLNCEFFDTPFGVFGDVRDLEMRNCSHRYEGLSGEFYNAPRIGTSLAASEVTRITVSDCKFSGWDISQSLSDDNETFGLLVNGETMINVKIADCEFFDLNHGNAYSGGGSPQWDVVRLLSNDFRNITVKNCNFSSTGFANTGSNEGTTALRFDSHDESTLSTTIAQHIHIVGNTVGVGGDEDGAGGDYEGQFLLWERLRFRGLVIEANHVTVDTGTDFVDAEGIIGITITTGVGVSVGLRTCNNYFRATTTAANAKEIIEITGGGGGDAIRSWVCNGNTFTTDASGGWGANGGIVVTTTTLLYFNFSSNQAFSEGNLGANTGEFNTDFTGAVGPSVVEPPLPAAAAFWDDNNNVQNV